MPRKATRTAKPPNPSGKKATLQGLLDSSLTPFAAIAAFLATVVGVITKWDAIRGLYLDNPVFVGIVVAVAAAIALWALVGHYGVKHPVRAVLVVRLATLLVVAIGFFLIVLFPRICIIGNVCGPSPFPPFRLNSLFTPAYAQDTSALEILTVTVDQSKSSFLLSKDDLSIHAARENTTRISLTFDRQMLSIFQSASCRGIRGEGPVEDALPILRAILKERGRNDLVQKLADYNGYRDLILYGGDSGFIEARPTAAELANLFESKPEWYTIVMRWMVECVGVADPVLIWTLRNNSDARLTLISVDYLVLDVGQVMGAGPDVLEPIDVMPHDLYHSEGTQVRDISPQIVLNPGGTVAIRIRYRLEATDWGLTWLVRPIFRTVEGVFAEGPEIKIFSAKNKIN